MITKVSKTALKYLGASSPSELVKCKSVIDTSGKSTLVLVNKKDLEWARKQGTNAKAYIIEPNTQFEYPSSHKFHGQIGHRGDKTAWVYGPKTRCVSTKKRGK